MLINLCNTANGSWYIDTYNKPTALLMTIQKHRLALIHEEDTTYDVNLNEDAQFKSPSDAAVWLREYYRDRLREELSAIFLNTTCRPIGWSVLSTGGLAAALVEPRQLIQAGMLMNAASVIIAHNHPSGNLEPSREDIAITKQLAEACKVVGMPLVDHLIITASSKFTSLAEKGHIKPNA